ncbi:MAG: replication initiation protein [Parvularculales bacterium]
MLLENINEVIKASPAIQIQGKMTHLQRRAWNVLLANAYNELPNKEIHTASVAELSAKLGFDSKNDEYLKETLEALVDFTVEWNILGKDKKQEWGVASLLAEARIKNGICYYEYSHSMRQRLHNPRIYTKLNLRLQNQFKSQYALILWEVCFDYFDTNRGTGETPFIPLETFKELMGLDETDYPVFKVLSRDVIKSAISEINALTDYHVEVEHKRLGRKVAELEVLYLKSQTTSRPRVRVPGYRKPPTRRH